MLFLNEHLFPDVCGDGEDEQLCRRPCRKNSLSPPTLPGSHDFIAEPSVFLPASVKPTRKYSQLSCKNVFSSHNAYLTTCQSSEIKAVRKVTMSQIRRPTEYSQRR